jgi:hypothetical protein
MEGLPRAACGVRVVDVEARAALEAEGRVWAERTCADQGIELKVTDPVVALEIATLLYAGRGDAEPGVARRQAGRTRLPSKRLRPRTAGPMLT